MPDLKERVAALEATTAKLTEPAFLKDCRTDYFRDGLQGGGVRITHLPTGFSVEGRAKAGDVKDFARELAGDLGRMLEESGEAANEPGQASSSVPPLTRDQVRQLLRECVTVVKPGETLVVRVPWTTAPSQLREYQRVMDSAEGGAIPFRVLVVAGDELGVAEAEASADG